MHLTKIFLSLLLAAVLPLNCYARQFRQALPGYLYSFPRDHASHDDYKTEWWYFTGHLQADNGTAYGYELTFFRTAGDNDSSKNNWDLKNIYFTHFAVTDLAQAKFFYAEKLNRHGLASADARGDVCYVYNQLWSMELLGNQFILRADAPEYSIHLLLSPRKKPTIQGINGVSQKASCQGCASHYYSMTRLQTTGTIYLKNKPILVHGNSWMDHEFGSNQLAAEQIGWDWFSVQLDNNVELMLYLMRRKDGSIDPNSSGTLTRADGSTKHLSITDFSVKSLSTWKSAKTGGTYPMNWQVNIPSEAIKLNIESLMLDQELGKTACTGVTYWEGASKVDGSLGNNSVKGQAYVEMTGYAERFHQSI